MAWDHKPESMPTPTQTYPTATIIFQGPASGAPLI